MKEQEKVIKLVMESIFDEKNRKNNNVGLGHLQRRSGFPLGGEL